VEDLIARNRKPDEAIEQRVVIQLRGFFGKISKLSGSVSLCPALLDLTKICHRNRNRCRSPVADKDQHMEQNEWYGGMIRNGKDRDPTLPNQPFRSAREQCETSPRCCGSIVLARQRICSANS